MNYASLSLILQTLWAFAKITLGAEITLSHRARLERTVSDTKSTGRFPLTVCLPRSLASPSDRDEDWLEHALIPN